MTIEMLGEFILGGALKGAGVVLIGGLIAWRWKRGAAADRHTLWLLVLASFLILPLMQQWGPQWRVLPKASQTVIGEPRVVLLENLSSAIAESDPSESWVSPVASRSSSVPAVSMDSSSLSSTQKLPWWVIIWMCGAAIVLGRVFVGRIALWVYGRQLENGKIQVFANELRDRLGITRPVEVVLSGRRKMPMTWGWRRPKVLLPAAARNWEENRLKVVLLHELAHVKRCDAATQGLVQLVTAIYWFHPLVWFAVWRLVGERERACDQAVVDEGVKPSNYARQLMAVALADTSLVLCPSAGMGMARKGELEKRVQSLLDTRPRRRMKWRWITAIVCGWAGLMCPLAMLTAQENVNAGLEAAPPTLEGDLKVGEETADPNAAVPEVMGWRLELRLLSREEVRQLNGENHSEASSPELRAEFTSDPGAVAYQVRDLQLLVDDIAFRLKEAQDWSEGLTPKREGKANYLRLENQGWEPVGRAREHASAWLPGDHSVQVVFLLEGDNGQVTKLSSNVVKVDFPDIQQRRAGLRTTQESSALPEEITRNRYAEAVAKLQEFRLRYGEQHPKMIEQQQLIDSLSAQVRSARDASPSGVKEHLQKRYDQEVEKLGELGLKYLHRHPKIVQQKALIGEIAGQIRDVQAVIRVASAASGIVSEVHVIRSQDVKKGSVLLTLDGRRARLAVESATVQLDLARRKLETVSLAFKAGQADQVEYGEANAQLKLAETALAVAKIDLEDLSIRAPADGKVVSVDAKVGEYVSPEKPVVHLRPKTP